MYERSTECKWGRYAPAVVVLTAALASGQSVGGPDVLVNQDPPGLNQNENVLVLNVAMPGNLVMAYNDNPWPNGVGLGISFSTDGGVQWFDRQLPYPPGMVSYFDPMAAADTAGLVYAGGIAVDSPPVGTQAVSGLYVYQSADGGNSWSAPATIATAGPPLNQRLNDRGHLIVDDNFTSPYLDSVYVTWIQDVGMVGPFSDILFSASPPVLMTFSPPQIINDAPGGAMGIAPHLAAAADGTIYAVWIEYDVTNPNQVMGNLFCDRSTNGGGNWGPDMLIPYPVLTLPKVFSDTIGTPGVDADTAPVIAVHPMNPLDVYVVYPADTDGIGGDEGDIYLVRSLNGGMLWQPPILINSGGFQSGHQFAPWIDIKPDGTIDVAFYSGFAHDGQPTVWACILTQSTDGGNTWNGFGTVSDQVLPAPFKPNSQQRWLGEYLSLVTHDGVAHLGFCSSAGDPFGQVYYDQVENRDFGDCDGNGIPDFIDLAFCTGGTWCQDCNNNGVLDLCDVDPSDPDGDGWVSPDNNGNGIPDECELVATPYCFCATGAPCSNTDPNAGCSNSTGVGALLTASGTSSVSADDLVLTTSQMPTSQFALGFKADNRIGPLVFGDGFRCAGANLVRFGVLSTGPSGSIAHGPGLAATYSITPSSVFRFHTWYRDPPGPCGSGFNTSSAVEVSFLP